jgi:nucleoside-diphosphate-sugar epimerase
VDQLVKDTDIIIHMAGFLGTAETIDEMEEAASTNILGTLNVLQAAVRHQKRCVYITIGNDWLNPYSVTKNCSKDLALILNQYRGGDIVIVRGLNAYGDRQKAYPVRKVFPTFCLQALKGDPIEIYDEGQQIIDLVHVRDLARGLVLAGLAPEGVALHQHVIDLGTAKKTTVNYLAELVIKEAHGPDVNWKDYIRYLPLREGEPKDSITLGKIERSVDLINYEPEIRLIDGLKEAFGWYKDHLDLFDEAEYQKYLHAAN